MVKAALECVVGTHNRSKTGFPASCRVRKDQHLRPRCLALVLCLLACTPGATSRSLVWSGKVEDSGPVRAHRGGRRVSPPAEFRVVVTDDRLGVSKEPLSTSPNVKKPYWCVAKDYVNPNLILTSLNWACSKSGGVDCKAIQKDGNCFLPDTLLDHASYAFNMYYQSHGFASSTCDFEGAAWLVTEDPSTPGCVYLNSIVASHDTVYSSSPAMKKRRARRIAAAVASVILYSMILFVS